MTFTSHYKLDSRLDDFSFSCYAGAETMHLFHLSLIQYVFIIDVGSDFNVRHVSPRALIDGSRRNHPAISVLS